MVLLRCADVPYRWHVVEAVGGQEILSIGDVREGVGGRREEGIAREFIEVRRRVLEKERERKKREGSGEKEERLHQAMNCCHDAWCIWIFLAKILLHSHAPSWQMPIVSSRFGNTARTRTRMWFLCST